MIILFCLFFTASASFAQKAISDTFYVAQWNIENLFDTKDDPLINDSEFLPESNKNWTEERLTQKLNNLAKVINYLNNGIGPDLICLEEIENMDVLKHLAHRLKDKEYILVHRDSPDARGIDVAMLYNRALFDIVDLFMLKVELPTKYNTRDIMHAIFKVKMNGELIHVFGNHWPSRSGGREKSEPNRFAAAEVLRKSVDSVLAKDANANIIALGDFNDEPTDLSLTKYLGAINFECNKNYEGNNLLNLGYKMTVNSEGSYLYYGEWDMIDQIIISKGLINEKGMEYICDSYHVVMPDFMIIKEGNRKGGALPTYMGSKFSEGYSDHFPVGAKFIIRDK